MICYKSKLFSLHVLELVQNVLRGGNGSKEFDTTEGSPFHATELN
jgi:hypothetical protein